MQRRNTYALSKRGAQMRRQGLSSCTYETSDMILGRYAARSGILKTNNGPLLYSYVAIETDEIMDQAGNEELDASRRLSCVRYAINAFPTSFYVWPDRTSHAGYLKSSAILLQAAQRSSPVWDSAMSHSTINPRAGSRFHFGSATLPKDL